MTDCVSEGSSTAQQSPGNGESEIVRRSVGVEEVRKAWSSYEARVGLNRIAEQV